MGRLRQSEDGTRRRRPATSPEQRELQLADAAFDLAEEQIRSGTASSQVITACMRFGSTRERLEQQRMEHEIELMEEKKKQLEGQQKIEAMYAEALGAMRTYSGLGQGSDNDFVDGSVAED